MTTPKESERWLLSFYRNSEISGALFFGRLARTVKAGPIQTDLTRHFADESNHAAYWTQCMKELDVQPLRIKEAYQDAYLEAGGLPMNIMEILAVTLVFERRVVSQYVAHSKAPNLAEPIRNTLDTIMSDERWHVRWVSDALTDLEGTYGKDTVAATVKRYVDADREVYRRTIEEHSAVIGDLMTFREI
jgi:rubrerythrin